MPPDLPTEKPRENTPEGRLLTIHRDSLGDIVDAFKNKFDEKTTPEEQRENMRGIVTSRIIGMYSLCVAVIVFVGVGKAVSASPETSIMILKSLVDYLSVLVLPVITLVLGFYFGSEKK